ncbi:MAG: four helix bundle protein [Chloroflexi bacterium]|nr:four helix bundle protein [Chloroflexota bacterium]
MERGFRKLIAWQKGHQLVLLVYELTARHPPRHELFGLTSQMRRAAVSVPANIAEGYTRRHQAEFRQGLNIAKGSLAELEYYLELSRDLGYLTTESYDRAASQLEEVGKILHGLLQSQL